MHKEQFLNVLGAALMSGVRRIMIVKILMLNHLNEKIKRVKNAKNNAKKNLIKLNTEERIIRK